MKRILRSGTLALLGTFLLSGCGDNGPTNPSFQDLTLEDQLALELLADPGTIEIALDMAGVEIAAAHGRGWHRGNGNSHRSQAQQRFQEARQALEAGDLLRARERAREGRRLIAQAIEASGGTQTIRGMVERLESLPVEVMGDPETFLDPGHLGNQLGMLASAAREAFRKGNRIRAGALGVLGEQVFRFRNREGGSAAGRGPEVAVAMAQEAVELAERLLGDLNSAWETEEGELLGSAHEYLAAAQDALEAGEWGRSIHLAHLATWWALNAVVLPGGISDEEVRLIHDLAETLLGQAQAAVEADPTPMGESLLERAQRMFRQGGENVQSGGCRGLGALWQSAVISSYLLA